MIKTFVGFSDTGLDLAVKNAYKNVYEFMEKGIEGLNYIVMSTTSNVVLLNSINIEYWFTITISID